MFSQDYKYSMASASLQLISISIITEDHNPILYIFHCFILFIFLYLFEFCTVQLQIVLHGSWTQETTADALHAPGVCAWALAKFGAALDSAGLWLDEATAEAVVTFGDLFMQTYLSLSCKALRDCRPLYRQRPKFHSMKCELLDRVRSGCRLNCRYVGCFGEEDYIGKVTKVIKGAVHPKTLGKRVLERLLLTVNMHLATLKAERKK